MIYDGMEESPMTTPNNTVAGLAEKLSGMADQAYCDYIRQLKQPECLGWETKVASGAFSSAELRAHTNAGELLGRHRALAEAAKLAALASPAPIAPDLDAMVNRFLCWRLPDDFAPDGGVSFVPWPHQLQGNLHWPVGTNLLTAAQARAMFEHCLAGENDESWKQRALSAESDIARLHEEFDKENCPTLMGEPTPSPPVGWRERLETLSKQYPLTSGVGAGIDRAIRELDAISQHPAAPSAPPSVAGDAGELPDAPWRPINELPESDDLFWFMRLRGAEVIVDEPRAPQAGGYDADEWDYFAPAVAPPIRRLATAEQPGRVVGARTIDGVHVIIAKPFTEGVREQLLVRYDDYIEAVKPGSAVQGEAVEQFRERLIELFYRHSQVGHEDDAALADKVIELCAAVTTPSPAPAADPFVDGNGVIRSGILPDAPAADHEVPSPLGDWHEPGVVPAAEQGDATCDCPLDHLGQHIYVCTERPLAFGLHDPAAAFNQDQPEARGVEGMGARVLAAQGSLKAAGADLPYSVIRDAVYAALAAAPSGVRVDDAMVERAMRAFMETHRPELEHSIRAALTAALSANEVSR